MSPITVQITNRRGLHARAAAKFVELASQFQAECYVTKDAMTVSGRSIMGLMMLAAAQGHDIVLSAQGVDAEEAIRALSDLIQRKFDEQE